MVIATASARRDSKLHFCREFLSTKILSTGKIIIFLKLYKFDIKYFNTSSQKLF